MSIPTEKPAGPSAFTPYLDAVANVFHPVSGPVLNTYARFHGWKENMGLVQPGTVENLTRDVQREFRRIKAKKWPGTADNGGRGAARQLDV